MCVCVMQVSEYQALLDLQDRQVLQVSSVQFF